MDAPLGERPTARVVLLDPAGRVLLMRGRLPDAPDGPSFWYTVGGGAEIGETLAEAAAREIVEETGLLDAKLGPVLWTDEVVLADVSGVRRLFKQSYFLARTAGGALSRLGWQDYEHRLTDDVRWWTLGELRLSRETIYPIGFAVLLADVLAGRMSSEPLVVATPDGPVSPTPRPA
ncbi:MAG: NUDIX hydrolase [Caulobacteraceae bacterium]